jgi:hypothetical protein
MHLYSVTDGGSELIAKAIEQYDQNSGSTCVNLVVIARRDSSS